MLRTGHGASRIIPAAFLRNGVVRRGHAGRDLSGFDAQLDSPAKYPSCSIQESPPGSSSRSGSERIATLYG